MGFMDKAKKMGEQAQSKLDEVQKQFNEGQPGGSQTSQAPPVEYDQHGRPIRSEATPADEPAAPAAPEPAAPPAESTTPPHGDPVAPPPSPPAADQPEEKDEYAPPKLTGGDPLAG
jgi:hypothetical protein